MYMHGLYLPMITVLEIKMKYLIFKKLQQRLGTIQIASAKTGKYLFK